MSRQIPRPYSLLAEVTYRCPLHCPYCSNPTQFSRIRTELTRDEWKRVLDEAAELERSMSVSQVANLSSVPISRNSSRLRARRVCIPI